MTGTSITRMKVRSTVGQTPSELPQRIGSNRVTEPAKKMHVMNTKLITLILIARSLSLCRLAAGEPPPAGIQTLEELFHSVVAAEGQSYFTLRSNLVAHSAGAESFLETKLSSRDLHERVLASSALSWVREPPTNYLRTKILANLVREANSRHSGLIRSVESLSFGVWTISGPIQFRDALHEDAAVAFLLEVSLKGPTSLPDDPLVAAVAKDHVLGARCMAAGIVGIYQSPDVLPVLRELLQSQQVALRVCAACGLGKMKTPEATEVLIDAFSDSDVSVREECRVALFDFTDQDFRDDKAKWLDWWQQNKQHWPFNDRLPGHNPVPLWSHDK